MSNDYIKLLEEENERLRSTISRQATEIESLKGTKKVNHNANISNNFLSFKKEHANMSMNRWKMCDSQ